MITLKYQIMREYNYGTEEEPNIVQTINEKEVNCNADTYEAAYSTALAEAYNGEVTVEEVEDEERNPTQLDIIEAQVTYTAMMTDTLL